MNHKRLGSTVTISIDSVEISSRFLFSIQKTIQKNPDPYCTWFEDHPSIDRSIVFPRKIKSTYCTSSSVSIEILSKKRIKTIPPPKKRKKKIMKTSNKLDSFESNPPIWSEEAEEEPKSRTESISNRFQISRPSLLSFDNTIQNVSIISFLLGCSFGLNLMFWYFDRIGIYHQVHLYLFVLTIFHLLEFLVTAIWNHSRVTVSCKCVFLIILELNPFFFF